MPYWVGQYVWAEFSGERVAAVILEVKEPQLLVQQDNTRRRDWVASSDCSER